MAGTKRGVSPKGGIFSISSRVKNKGRLGNSYRNQIIGGNILGEKESPQTTLVRHLLGSFLIMNCSRRKEYANYISSAALKDADDYAQYYGDGSSLIWKRDAMVQYVISLLDISRGHAQLTQSERDVLYSNTSVVVKAMNPDTYHKTPDLIQQGDIEIGEMYWKSLDRSISKEGSGYRDIEAYHLCRMTYDGESIAKAKDMLEDSYDPQLRAAAKFWDVSEDVEFDPNIAYATYLGSNNLADQKDGSGEYPLYDRLKFYLDGGNLVTGQESMDEIFKKAALFSYYSPGISDDIMGKLKATGYTPSKEVLEEASRGLLSVHNINLSNPNQLVNNVVEQMSSHYSSDASLRKLNENMYSLASGQYMNFANSNNDSVTTKSTHTDRVIAEMYHANKKLAEKREEGMRVVR